MLRAVTREEMKEIDHRATEQFGVPGIVLMENAGRSVADVVEAILKPNGNGRVLVLCGHGNNGGDGFVAARHLFNRGRGVRVALFCPPRKITGDARTNYEILEKMELPIQRYLSDEQMTLLKGELLAAKVIVDALLGTGAKGEIREPLRTVIEMANNVGRPIVAVDTPSGLDVNTGKALGVCIEASRTVTCGLPKTGFYRETGAQVVGYVHVADLGCPKQLFELANQEAEAD